MTPQSKPVVRGASGILTLAVMLVVVSDACALDPIRAITQYGHQTWTDRTGLPGQAVYNLTQTSDGYLWLQSGSRLIRFDGVRFTTVELQVEDQPIRETARAICRGADGQLLIRTVTRTLRHGNGTTTDVLPPAPVPSGMARSISETSRGRIWVGSDCALFTARGDELLVAAEYTGQVYAFLEDRQKNVWVATSSGLSRFDDGTLVKGPKDFPPIGDVRAIGQDRFGTFWVGTSGGLFRLVPGQPPEYMGEPGPSGLAIAAIVEDRHGNIWVGTNGAGLFRYSDQGWQTLTAADGLSGDVIHSLYEDSEGSLWIGTNGGLDQLRDTKLFTVSAREGLPNDDAQAVLAARDGSIYVATNAGLARLLNGTTTVYTAADGLADNVCTTLYEDLGGRIWVGTQNGLSRLKDGQVEAPPGGDRMKSAYIVAIGEDDESMVVMTSDASYFRIGNDDLVINETTVSSRLGSDTNSSIPYVFTMCRDARGTLWYGTAAGLFKMHSGNTTTLVGESGVTFPVTSIYDDGRGYLWLTGRTPGVTRYRPEDGQVIQFTTAQGLFDDEISRALCDRDGNLWATTLKGIFRVDRPALDAVAEGRSQTVQSVAYGTADGMRTTECSIPERQPAGCLTTDGKLWFTSRLGVVVVDPGHAVANDQLPPVIVEQLDVDGESQSLRQEIRLAPDAIRLTFQFTALSLRVGERVQFKYRLEGLDSDWIDAGSRRMAEYSYLAPGQYCFRVIACNDDGVWNKKGAQVSCILEPRFYQTYWFRSGSWLTGLLIVFGGYRMRVRGLKAREKDLALCVTARTQALQAEIAGHARTVEALLEASSAAEAANHAKSEFLANMSHEIRTPMNGIIGLTQLVMDTELNSEQRQYADGVRLSAELLLQIINSILDFSRIEAGKMELEQIDFDLREPLTAAIKTLALRAQEKDLELVWEVQPDVPDHLIGDPVRLWQVMTNLIGNALKFTQHGEIAVTVKLDEPAATDAATARHETDGTSRNALASGSGADRQSEPGASALRLIDLSKPPDDSVSLHFTVRDTGIGIPAEKQAELFQPFTQADTSTTRNYGGTGLGLAISARFAELMSGRIWFESEEGCGTTFHFTARFGRQTSPVAKLTPRLPSDVIDLRVLVVDDNATNRRILKGLLTRWGMKPTIVDSGPTALETLHTAVKEQAPFELILLDVQMPEMDGFTVLEHIRMLPEIDRPTILMLSSADQRGDIARARALGAAAYLHKPINPPDLLDSIMAVLGHDRVRTKEQSSISSTQPIGRGQSLRILVTEDNQLNQLLTVRTLEKTGHSVAVANNGEEALAAVNREPFDLVLMDVQMPVMDGFQATARIREQEQITGKHQPIVAMTAHALKGDRERCLEAGMDGYVSKPIRKSELFAAITAAMNAEGRPSRTAHEITVPE